jgi:hypothetical protein
MTSARVSTTVWASQPGDSQQVARAVLFPVLKTGKGLLIVAALARPTKLVDVDAQVTGDLCLPLAPRSKCVPKAGFAKQLAMCLVFNSKEKLMALSNYGENPMARDS